MANERRTGPVILCVDDEASILRSLERCFAGEGYTILKALSGAEALGILAEFRGTVDLIIVDQKMPQMMGDEFLRIAHERYGLFKSIMLTGYAEPEDLTRAIKVGHIVRFLAKPWSNQELLLTVRSVLSSSGGGPQ